MRIRRALGAVAPVLLLVAALCPDASAANGALTVEYDRCSPGTGAAGTVCLHETVRRRTENPPADKCVELLSGGHTTVQQITNGTNSRAVYYSDNRCTRRLGSLAPRAAVGNVAARSVKFTR
ncbi:hypothetical protein QZH56_05480 [Streptomyces olivoreticuli]|uniref:Secreted protein n=1 Tax=Streptomyces blastmyceticus TaxID=68180 RepID=A0ABN0XMU0_9ACTN|nr:hypothetical protein [Streptomyces olivoreticuli]WKK25072.1 hypothetical protein QZH56_05480 [Streptomyces olivoreticuli]